MAKDDDSVPKKGAGAAKASGGGPSPRMMRIMRITRVVGVLLGGFVTLVGAIVSQRAFQDAVLGGYTGIHESQFRRVTAEVPEKEFREEAYIYVPRLTFRETGLETAAENVREPEGRERFGRSGPIFQERVENAFTDGTFHGDFHFKGR